MPSDYYELLGIPKHASQENIDAAYRALVRRVHPDAGGSSTLFRFVEEAHEVLSDPTRRAQYDAHGNGSKREPEPDTTGNTSQAGTEYRANEPREATEERPPEHTQRSHSTLLTLLGNLLSVVSGGALGAFIGLLITRGM